MTEIPNLRSRAWLIELLERSQTLSEDVRAKLDLFFAEEEDLSVDELGLDSLALMQLSIDVEDEVGVQMSVENFSKARTLGELLESLNSAILNQGKATL